MGGRAVLFPRPLAFAAMTAKTEPATRKSRAAHDEGRYVLRATRRALLVGRFRSHFAAIALRRVATATPVVRIHSAGG